MAIIEKSWDGHVPGISVTWTYDPDTRKATVKWKCSGGYFRYSWFRFNIFFRYKRGKGDWPVKSYKITGMENPGGENIWKNGSGSRTFSLVAVKGQTQVAFGMYCSAVYDGGSCTSNLGDGPTRVTNWTKIQQSSNTPRVYIPKAYRYLNAKDGFVTYNNICSLTNGIYVTWDVTGSNIKKMACLIQEKWGPNDAANLTWVYPTSSPKTYSGNGVLTDTFKIDKCLRNGVVGPLLPAQWYDITIAVATSSENIADQWDDDAVSIRVRTKEEAPTVVFTAAGPATNTVEINWSATFPTRGNGAPMYYINYKLHDDTTNTDITTTGVALAQDASQEVSSGKFTVTGLTIGHKYTITPNGGMTQLDGVSLGTIKGCSFTAASKPILERVWNMSDGTLVFGEPGNDASVNIRVSGTAAGVWDIEAYIGIVQNNTARWLDHKNVDVGDNVFKMSDAVLDAIYKAINPSSSFTFCVQLNYKLPDGSLPGYTANRYTMYFKGNMKTAHVGVGSTGQHRAKVWVGAAGGTKRAIVWVGVGGVPRRVI